MTERRLRESAWGRACHDLWAFHHTAKFYWGGVVLGLVGVFLGGRLIPVGADIVVTVLCPAVGSALAVVFGVIGAFGLFLIVAPYRQRDEARAELEQMSSRSSSLIVRPISGPESGWRVGMAEDLEKPGKVYARLEVSSIGKFSPRCTARIMAIYALGRPSGDKTRGTVMRLAEAQRMLCWSPESDRRQHVDLADGVPVLLDLAVLDQSNASFFQIVQADTDERHRFLPGWYKLDVLIASESEDANSKMVELLLGLGRRRNPPSGLNLMFWEGNGEKLLTQPMKQETD